MRHGPRQGHLFAGLCGAHGTATSCEGTAAPPPPVRATAVTAPDCAVGTSWQARLAAAERHADVLQAESVLLEMRRDGVTPSPPEWRTLFRVYDTKRCLGRLEQLLPHVGTSAECFEAVLQIHASRGQAEPMMRVYAAMRRQGLPPTPGTFRALHDGFCRASLAEHRTGPLGARWVPQLQPLLQEMEGLGVREPGLPSLLLLFAADAGDIAEAGRMLAILDATAGPLPAVPLCRLVSALRGGRLRNGSLPEAAQGVAERAEAMLARVAPTIGDRDKQMLRPTVVSVYHTGGSRGVQHFLDIAQEARVDLSNHVSWDWLIGASSLHYGRTIKGQAKALQGKQDADGLRRLQRRMHLHSQRLGSADGWHHLVRAFWALEDRKGASGVAQDVVDLLRRGVTMDKDQFEGLIVACCSIDAVQEVERLLGLMDERAMHPSCQTLGRVAEVCLKMHATSSALGFVFFKPKQDPDTKPLIILDETRRHHALPAWP